MFKKNYVVKNFILIILFFFSNFASALAGNDIPKKYQFPKYDSIELPVLKITFQNKTGNLLFIRNKTSQDETVSVYLLNNKNNLSKVFEIYNLQKFDKLLGAFVYKNKIDSSPTVYILTKLGKQPPFSYRYYELPVFVNQDVLEVLFFYGDAVASDHFAFCTEDFEEPESNNCEFSSIEMLKKFLHKNAS